MDRAGTLILVRHGESTANADGTFTGSRDVDLSARGLEQSRARPYCWPRKGLVPDVVFLSRMLRARRTAQVMLGELGLTTTPLIQTWRLNERDYGLLMGMPKIEVHDRFGPERFHTWRRTLHGRPPPMPVEQRAAFGLVPLDDDPLDPQPPGAPGEGESLLRRGAARTAAVAGTDPAGGCGRASAFSSSRTATRCERSARSSTT